MWITKVTSRILYSDRIAWKTIQKHFDQEKYDIRTLI